MSHQRACCCCLGYPDPDASCEDACADLHVIIDNLTVCSCNPFLSECCGPNVNTGHYFTHTGVGSSGYSFGGWTLDSDAGGKCFFSRPPHGSFTVFPFTDNNCSAGTLPQLSNGTLWTVEVTKATGIIKVVGTNTQAGGEVWFQSIGPFGGHVANSVVATCDDLYTSNVGGRSRSCCELQGI